TFEVHTWDRRTGERRRLTVRTEGTGYRVPARLETDGRHVWWFDDAKGNELGQWVREAFAGGDRRRMAADLEPAYSAGLALASAFAIIGRSRGGEGTSVYLVREGEAPRRLYLHAQSASVGDVSRDESMFVLSHSEHGDSRNRALRIMDTQGRTVAEKWEGPGRGLSAGRWSPVRGDARLVVTHERTGLARPLL
ncbi:MAG: S9 family peptidase, partial [Chloroflexota bacterium]